MIEKFVKKIPGVLEKESGKVFYSGREAFSGAGRLYILGRNPGGSPRDPKEEKIASPTQKVLKDFPQNWSAYRDENSETNLRLEAKAGWCAVFGPKYVDKYSPPTVPNLKFFVRGPRDDRRRAYHGQKIL